MASHLSSELAFLILQFLDEEKFKETRHKFERESGLYFDMKYFEDVIINGKLEEAEEYLNGFTKLDENRYSMKIFFNIRKQKYIEAVDKGEHAEAVRILRKELKAFPDHNDYSLYMDLAALLTLKNIREHEKLVRYTDAKSARVILFTEVKRLLELNPVFSQKLQFPNLPNSRLRTLINQSLNWQRNLCKNHVERQEIMTLYKDHICPDNFHPRVRSNPLLTPMPPQVGQSSRTRGLSLGITIPATSSSAHPAHRANPTSIPSATVGSRPFSAAFGNNTDSENAPKRPRPVSAPEEAIAQPTINRSEGASSNSLDDLPRNVVKSLDQSSYVKCMDFHPVQEILLLVGTSAGAVSTWDVGIGQRRSLIEFQVWNLDACSKTLQETLARDYSASVMRVKWTPDGTIFGVAFSKHIVQLFWHRSPSRSAVSRSVYPHLEINAHVGSVNDLAFSRPPNNNLCVVTCGEDKKIKVWAVSNGAKLFTFEGHEAPVYSVCPHSQNNTPFVLSTAIDGSVKAWLYNSAGSTMDFDKTVSKCSVLAYSEDGTRVFSCGMREDGESFIFELDEGEGSVIREYLGLGEKPAGFIQFHNIKNRFLVAGDDCAIKYWDMDHANMLMALKINGLPACPCVRFSKKGKLLAVSTSDNRVKILSNIDGLRLFNSIEAQTPPSNAGNLPPVTEVEVRVDTSPQESRDEPRRLKEINERSQLRALRIADSSLPVVKLICNSAGNMIIALMHNGVHKVYKWQGTPKDMAITAWHHPKGRVMANDTDQANLGEAVPCFALSKKDGFLISASGAKMSLFNVRSFKTMASVFSPPPAATCVAFLPRDNNIAAVGLDDSSILIYHIRANEVEHKLGGHTKRVTGLAFSTLHNALVSSGSDYQLCLWDIDGWERRRTARLEFPQQGRVVPLSSCSNTKVQFHQDQTHVLVVHATQIAIYTAPRLERIKQWFPSEVGLAITDATYSCNGQSIYIALRSGGIRVLTASSFTLTCKINPESYLIPNNPSLSSSDIYPTCIASNPTNPNQFILGLMDGGIYVMEPEGEWRDLGAR